MMLRARGSAVNHKFFSRYAGISYSWSSETSPVIAENPRNGTSGSETFLSVKHGVQSSPGLRRHQKPTSIFQMSRLTSLVVNLDLITVTVSYEHCTCGEKIYIKKSVPKVSNLEFGRDVRSPIESLEKTSGRLAAINYN